MTTVVGVRFREVGKIYYFDPGDLDIKTGDHVIVETVRGTEYGTAIIGRRQVEDEEIVQPLKEVKRIATPDDDERNKSNREKEADAFNTCKEKIIEHGLDMKLIAAEYTFDNSKVLFYFTADGRVDFRELVKDLASIFRIRIELRQVGVRDETKIMGGIGGCGRPLCCASYLSDFVPVSIRMAKEQNLSLNPQKISGVCGRLMCCLKNEADTYCYLNSMLPKEGTEVITADGRVGKAESLNVLRQKVKVIFEDEDGNKESEEIPASELKFEHKKNNKYKPEMKNEEEDLDDLVEELESEEEDPELAALAEAEIEDIEKQEEKEDSEENTGNRKKNKKKRFRRRRRPNRNNGTNNNGANNNGTHNNVANNNDKKKDE